MAEVQSVLRTEEKYLLPYPQALLLRQRLNTVLSADAYANDGGYRVKSLYFDSFRNTDFHEKLSGVYHRKKVRLRIYDENQQTAKLELKEKHGDLQQKISVTVSRSDALALCDGDYSVLLEYDTPAAMRLYSVMATGLYRPVAVIEYDRAAFVYPAFSTRITFDSKVRTSELSLDLFNPDLPWDYVMDQEVLLEVKYNRVLPSFISSVLDCEALNRISLSKYFLGRKYVLD